MQINLKQTEIIQALKGYVTQQGINLGGKTVHCTFTAGRKDSGISVEITIEDQEIPGYADDSAENSEEPPAQPVKLSAVTTPTTPPKSATELAYGGVFTTSVVPAEPITTEPKPATPSLFGS